MKYQSVNVRLPDGNIRSAELTTQTNGGYRHGRVKVGGYRIRGRVTARHGYTDGRILPFEVNASDAWLLDTAEQTVYLR